MDGHGHGCDAGGGGVTWWNYAVVAVGVLLLLWVHSRTRGGRLGSRAVLRRHGLDARGAVKRARKESPELYRSLTRKRPRRSGDAEGGDQTA